MYLNDKEIRPALINFLETRAKKPKKVVEELSVSYCNARADIVGVYNTLHCFEIKGQTDSIQRINAQGKYYNTSFLKITLVTTKNHLEYAIKNAPPFWGILLAFSLNGETHFKYVRKATKNPYFNKEEALHTLWKNELMSLSESNSVDVKKTMSKDTISKLISNIFSDNYIAESISKYILNRTYGLIKLYI